MAHGFSDVYHVFARKQCILCLALRQVALPLEQMRTALLGGRLIELELSSNFKCFNFTTPLVSCTTSTGVFNSNLSKDCF